MIDITTSGLFDTSDIFFKDLFYKTYPWEIIPLIKEYVTYFSNAKFHELSNGVFIGEGVKIHPSSVIEGPAIIGSNTEIRPFAYVRGSAIIGENCVVGNSTEIKNSVLINGAQVPHYNYVGDSILGKRAHMGAGAICSNLKSDGSNIVIHGSDSIATGMIKLGAIIGDNAEIGCNCVLNPGTVIGRNTNVYPLNSVRGVIPYDSIYKSKGNVIKKGIS